MFIKLTRKNDWPIWLNSSFIVTVEPAKNGGSIVVPIGDGLDYEVRETPDVVLSMLAVAPSAVVVPVPPPKSMTVTPDDVSPDDLRNVAQTVAVDGENGKASADAASEGTHPAAEGKNAAKKKGRKAKPSAKEERKPDSGMDNVAAIMEEPEPAGFREIVADLKSRKCRTSKRIRNALKTFFGKTDEIEIDKIIEMMINKGHILIGSDGHITWSEGHGADESGKPAKDGKK